MTFTAAFFPARPSRLDSPSLAFFLTSTLLLLSACTARDPPASTEFTAPTPAIAASSAEEKVVNVYNWADYIEPSSLEKFTAVTGIKVNYDVYDANEMLETKLLAGQSGYDVVVPAGGFIDRQIKAGVFRKLDRAQLPNWSNLDPRILQRLTQHDPGNQYGVNYMWGTNGIGYNEGRLKAIMPDAPVDSWRLVFDPAIASRFKECGIAMLDSPSDVGFVVLAYLGKDPNSESDADLALVEQTLMAIRPYVRTIHTVLYKDALASGDACIAVGWSGDVMQARDRAAELDKGDVIRYSIPKEGSLIWFDMLAIPADAPHPDNAHAFINFMQRPEIAAANSNYIKYANGNAASFPLIDESVRTNPGIFPPSDVSDKLSVDIPESNEYSRKLNRIWTRFVAGR
jgi:putrescine transport system substrate-binding protein